MWKNTHISSLCLLCLLCFPVMDLVARPISKTGVVHDTSGHVTMSSGSIIADVLLGKTLTPLPALKVLGYSMSCVLTIWGRGNDKSPRWNVNRLTWLLGLQSQHNMMAHWYVPVQCLWMPFVTDKALRGVALYISMKPGAVYLYPAAALGFNIPACSYRSWERPPEVCDPQLHL